MKTLLKQTDKERIWIEGYNSMRNTEFIKDIYGDKYIYSGKTSEISEDLAEEVVESGVIGGVSGIWYKDYGDIFEFKTAKESIQSACNKEYCIIYKEDI